MVTPGLTAGGRLGGVPGGRPDADQISCRRFGELKKEYEQIHHTRAGEGPAGSVDRRTGNVAAPLPDPFATAHSARVDNVLLGGSYHWTVDRHLAAQLSTAVPAVAGMVWHNRMFQRRAVEYLLAAGIRQFVDLGCGIPTLGAVHDIAHTTYPDAKVVYVDNDPITVELGRILLANQPRTLVVHADLRDPHRILGDPDVNDLLDLGRPVAVLALAALHHIPDDDALATVTAAWRDWTVSGSYLAVSHLCHERQRTTMTAIARLSADAGIGTVPRSGQQIRRLFHGWQLVAPGLTWTAAWRPEPDSWPDLRARSQRAGSSPQTSALPADHPPGSRQGRATPTTPPNRQARRLRRDRGIDRLRAGLALAMRSWGCRTGYVGHRWLDAGIGFVLGDVAGEVTVGGFEGGEFVGDGVHRGGVFGRHGVDEPAGDLVLA
jgi:hypothetical protein